MLKLITPERAREILEKYKGTIEEVSRKYGVPAAAIRAILYKEMTEMDIMDPAVDLVVSTQLTGRKDSSTGYGQIFGRTGLRAVEYAVEHGLVTYDTLGITTDHRLREQDPADIRLIWNKLNKEPEFNIEVTALNLLTCAEEMTGRTDFASFSEEEMKRALTRYNANTDTITAYGEDAYRLMCAFEKEC